MHLNVANRADEREYLIDRFIEMLELSDLRLQHALYPSTLPLLKRARAQADIEILERLTRESRAMKLCDRICEAGTACSDIGWFLNQVGRTKEGEKWLEYDSALSQVAWRVYEEEKARAAARAAEEERIAQRASVIRARLGLQRQRGEVVELD